MWESRVRGEISKSVWEPLLGFHPDGISTAAVAGVVIEREFTRGFTLVGWAIVVPAASYAVG
jgi:hypothetical protein